MRCDGQPSACHDWMNWSTVAVLASCPGQHRPRDAMFCHRPEAPVQMDPHFLAQGGALVGRVTWQADERWNLRVIGAGPEDQGLSFTH